MGTRNLTAVFIDGQYKIAQYGQWDGYPEGNGVSVLDFVRKIQNNKQKMELFKKKVRDVKWITQKDIDDINEKIKDGKIKNWKAEYPELSRDTGADILDLVFDRPNGIKLRNDLDFAFDHIFCEFIWAIDLDDGVFGLYVGDDESHKLRPVKTWIIGFAPPKEEFLSAFEEED